MAPASSTSSSSWRRRALAVAAFIALVFAGDQLLGRALVHLAGGSQLRFSRLYRGDVDAEIVVAGNSRAVGALPPPLIAETTGRSAFSIAYNGLDAELSRVLVADFLDRNRRPQTIVIEVSFVAQDPGPSGDFKLYWSESPRLRRLLAERLPSAAVAARASQLFRANSELLLRALYYRGRSDQSWMNRGRISAARYQALLAAGAEPLETRPELLAALRQLVASCQRAGVEVRLVVAPYLPATRDRLGVDRWLAELRPALAPLEIIDLSAALDSPELFADRIHVNGRGARRLLELMRERGLL